MATPGAVQADVLYQESFTYWPPAAQTALRQVWGDVPERVTNTWATLPGGDGRPGVQLTLHFAADPKLRDKGLSYWAFKLPEPLPLIDGLERLETHVKTDAPLFLKVGLAPYGFIYHGGAVQPATDWQTLALDQAGPELQNWCRRGNRAPDGAVMDSVIFAVDTRHATDVTLWLDRITITGAAGSLGRLRAARLRQRAAALRVAAVSLLWSPAERTVAKATDAIAVAATMGADLVVLPQECVATAGEPIPGPISATIGQQAVESKVWVVANYRELDAGRTYVTSILFDRAGQLVGKYRKSHQLPDEKLDLGDSLPVFTTEFGKLAMKIGTDRHFPEIDHCYAAQGAQVLCWSQMPEPVEDEHLQDRPVPGLAVDYGMTYVCARYASVEPGYISNMWPTYLGRPIGRSYVVNHEGVRIAATPRTGGGIALATLPLAQLGQGRPATHLAGFKMLSEPTAVPPKPAYAKRQARVAAIDGALPIDRLLARLDEVGRQGVDLACLYEMVWIGSGPPAQVAAQTKQAQANLALVAAKAREYHMYVLIGGVIDRLERNEAIVYDREGREHWRYMKIVQTHPEQICGDQVPVCDTDFGRFGCWICADEAHVEIPRCLLVQGADFIVTPTQSWGTDSTYRDDRDLSRAMNAGLFLVEVTHRSSEPTHASKILDPTGAVLAASPYGADSYCVATLDFEHGRPLRFIRDWTPHQRGGYLPEYQSDQQPQAANDLFDVIRQQRRPALYRPYLWPW